METAGFEAFASNFLSLGSDQNRVESKPIRVCMLKFSPVQVALLYLSRKCIQIIRVFITHGVLLSIHISLKFGNGSDRE